MGASALSGRAGRLSSRPRAATAGAWIVSDAFTYGRRFDILAVVDGFTRECVKLAADTSLSGPRLARELDAVIAAHGRP
jgi:transposase InsO family protein